MVAAHTIEVGQAHVVAKLLRQHAVAVAWHRERNTLEEVGGEGEDVLLIIDNVEGDAIVVGQRATSRQAADTTQDGEGEVLPRMKALA